MNDVTALELIKEFGLPLVLLVLGIFWLKPKFDRIINLVIDMAERPRADENHSTLESIIDFDSSINSLLREALVELNADWAQLWQFHNGMYGIGGTRCPFLRVSITHEVLSIGTQSMYTMFQNIPTAFLGDAIIKMTTTDRSTHKEGTAPTRSHVSNIMANFEAKTGHIASVRDQNRSLVALLGIGFKNQRDLTEAESSYLGQIAFQIGVFMIKLHEKEGDKSGNEK